MNREDYITCVDRNLKQSWCNRSLLTEFAFESIDHAVNTRLNKSRLLVCPECKKIIIDLLEDES